jgi:hypothetical protein
MPPGYAPPPGYYAPPPGYGPAYGPYYGAGMPPPREMERRSTGMMVGGILLTAFGAIGLGAGGVVYASSQTVQFDTTCTSNTNCFTTNRGGDKTAGIVLMVAGLAGIGVGIPLIVIGARKVPVDRSNPEKAREREERDAKLVVGPASAALHVSF